MTDNGQAGGEDYSIVATGLTRRYGSRIAVDSINLKVRAGEFFGFLGPNGAGKSTTITMLCGLLRPSAGSIQVAGHDVASNPLSVKRDIGILHEEAALYERLTGAEYLLFTGQMHGLSRAEAHRRTEELLDLMSLTDAADKLIQEYSMGMKKKTALAAALLHGPRVLFLDEAFNGVDPVSVHVLCDVLRQFAERRGTTIFFSSHVMETVERLCTRIAIINHGRIVGEGTMAELRTQAEAGADSPLEAVFLKLIGRGGTATATAVASPAKASLSWL